MCKRHGQINARRSPQSRSTHPLIQIQIHWLVSHTTHTDRSRPDQQMCDLPVISAVPKVITKGPVKGHTHLCHCPQAQNLTREPVSPA